MVVQIPLAAMLRGATSITFNAPDPKLPPLELAIRLMDIVSFYCVRWPSHPDIIAGIPISPGADVEPVKRAAVMKLESEFTRLGIEWPGAKLDIEG